MRKELRPRQVLALHQLRAALGSGKKRVILKAPTGFGKTVLAAEIIHRALERGKKVLFVVDAISLVDQTARSFYEQGITDIGVIQADHEMTKPGAAVQVCSQATLARRRFLPEADLVMIDEVHVFYKFYQKWMEKWDAIPFIGLSATPYTTGLGKHFQQLICTATTQELIEEGDLCDFRVFAPAKPDLSKVKVIAGDYNEAELALVMNNADLVAGIVETWKAKAEGLPTLVYAVDRAHARAIQAEFDRACIKFEYIDAYTEREDREVIKKQFHNGEVAGVVSVGCLTKGIDWDVRCIVLARPTKSDMLYQQIIGRGLRNAPGKEYVLILDHSSTTLRLGFVTEVDERHGALSMGKKGQSVREVKEPQSKECSQCHFVKPPKVWECPNCGHKPERQPDVVHIAGQLEELTKTQKRNNKSSDAVDKAFFLGECLTYALKRGRAEGWAKHLYRAKYGVWPNKITPFMRTPTAETLTYITAQAIRYAKGKANARV
jgi:superfamily II DNA or RNA helicase